ncbi:hypothetical protein DFQ27_001412 [Actinomortierella ambigua]|uniref:Uncharacterized protein n=1 Tax=Actinomortierella ambigua TaxID=1343610 RepID=A0A9P6QAA2_9FUNG|nr:hypothetical protein DFQ27_001412 [Actinomortierella ambigua]
MANIPDRFHYSSVMPLTEANLYKHTIKNPSSREEKLKHVLSYVDQQCDLVIQEQQAYLSWIDTTRWSQDPNNLRPAFVDRQDYYQPTPPARLSQLDPHPDFSAAFIPASLQQRPRKSPAAERSTGTGTGPAWESATRDQRQGQRQGQGQGPSNNTLSRPGRPKSPVAPTRPQRRQRPQHLPLQQPSPSSPAVQQQPPLTEQQHHDLRFDSPSPTLPTSTPWLQSSSSTMRHPQQHPRQYMHSQHDHDVDPYRYTNFGLNGLDPSVALPRALPRSMMRTRVMDASSPPDSPNVRDSFQSGYTPVVDEWSRLDDPSAGLSDPYLYSSFPSSKRQSDQPHQDARLRQDSPLPQYLLNNTATTTANSHLQQQQRQSLDGPSKSKSSRAGRWMSRFSLLPKRSQRHESMPTSISEPWTTPADRENATGTHQRFHSMAHRSGIETVGGGAELAAGPGSKAASNQSSSRVKRLFNGVFQRRSSKDTKGSSQDLYNHHHQFQELTGENESDQRSNRARSPLGDYPSYLLQPSSSLQPKPTQSSSPPRHPQQLSQQQQQQFQRQQGTMHSPSPTMQIQNPNSPHRQSTMSPMSQPLSLSIDGLNESLVDPLQQMPMLERDELQDSESMDLPYRPTSLTPPPPSSVMRHSNVFGQSLNNVSSAVYIQSNNGNGHGHGNGSGNNVVAATQVHHGKNRRPSSQILPFAYTKGEPLGSTSEAYLNSRRSMYDQGPTMVAIAQVQKADLEGLQQNASLGLSMFVGKTA